MAFLLIVNGKINLYIKHAVNHDAVVQANLASSRSGVEGHLVVSVVVTAFESPLTELTEPRASSAAHSIHIFPQKPENMKPVSLCWKRGLTEVIAHQ